MRIAVVGGGISGLVAARVLSRSGHQAVVFERAASLGGVWAAAYPHVRLQNTAEQYHASDFPWPFPVDLHPSREQILTYLQRFVDHYGLDLRLQHEVLALREEPDGWQVEYCSPQAVKIEHFDYVVVAAGQYTGESQDSGLADRELFTGRVITERNVRDLATLDAKQVAVVGFGKSALDMAAFAAERGAQVHHVFRAPRWVIPKYILGIHMSKLLFARMSTALIPAWVHPTAAEQLLHGRMQPLVSGFWSMLQGLVRLQTGVHGLWRDPEVRRRMALLCPEESIPYQMRSATAIAPDHYFSLVMQGRIEPYRSDVTGFTASGLRLADGREVPCDLVVLSMGFKSPSFPFLPPPYRALVEQEPDGAQLYRHLLHPRIPRLAFAGFNHGFLHIPSVEIATLWLCAHLRGDLVLPPVAEMESRIEEIRTWKREHTLFEPSRGCAISTRFHQYLDVMLADLGLNPYRKSNLLSEVFSGYTPHDYAGLWQEYEDARRTMQLPRHPLPLST